MTPRNTIWWIYQLESPEGFVRYVGATTNPERRYKEHLNGIKQGVALKRWVQGLKAEGKVPKMHILEQTTNQLWQKRERYWISFYRRKIGKTLLNKQAGGIVRRR